MNAQIFSIVVNANAASFASVATLTEVKIPKKWGLDNVAKYTYKNVQVNYSYESAVNRNRVAEGKDADFEAESLPWGEWLVPNKVITHKDKIYYRLYDIVGGLIDQIYFVNGHVATDAEMTIIKAWEASKTHTSRQGVQKEVKPTCVAEDNILYIKCKDEWRKADIAEVFASALAASLA